MYINICQNKSILVKINLEFFTKDLFFSFRDNCGNQLKYILFLISKELNRILIYYRKEK
ncbi:MAG: hypothetical protein G8D27_01735 [Buchnera aphidicola (Periphyllus aceris)]|nr:hypothetical protein [Buchnera aphidicola (Periphyllus aceris)]